MKKFIKQTFPSLYGMAKKVSEKLDRQNFGHRSKPDNSFCGKTVEFIGLPGAGKHVVAPLVRRELFSKGWQSGPPSWDYSTTNPSEVENYNGSFVDLFERHVKRLHNDGCLLPYIMAYLRESGQILQTNWYWKITGQSAHSCFLNESLLHHFGPEIVDSFSDGLSGSKDDLIEIIGKGRQVIWTNSPRDEVLRRLQTRLGKKVHWDWISAYGDRLDEFLDQSEARLERLVSILENLGVSIIKLNVTGDVPDAALTDLIHASLTRMDQVARNQPSI